MIDPKRVELSVYDGIPHLLAPVVTDTKEAGGYLRWVAEEMDNRYKLLEETGVRHIDRYNSLCTSGKLSDENATPLPYIIVIIDELGDLMLVAQKDVEDIVSQLAFMARAAGIHLVVATQRPSADVVTGIIKMNIPFPDSLRRTVSGGFQGDSGHGGSRKASGPGETCYSFL